MVQDLKAELCAYEAGLGVYGRSGLILHPQLGNRIVIGAFLTDATLEADAILHGFDPCQGCNACIRACPAGAYGSDGSYHGVWSMDRCLSKRQELVELGYSLCELCWKVCPAGKYGDRELFVMGMRGQNPLVQLATWAGDVQERILCDVTPELAQHEVESLKEYQR